MQDEATAVFLALACAAAVFQDPAPSFHVDVVRAGTQIVRVAMPWPRGAHAEQRAVQVGDEVAPCVTLLRWPDGSVAVSQIHARLQLDPAGPLQFQVEPLDAVSAPGAAIDPFVFDGELPLRVELRDAWDRIFLARLAPDPAESLVADLSTTLVHVHRYRSLLTRDGAAGSVEALFAIEGWLREETGTGVAALTLLIDNDPRAGEPVVGPARFRAVCVIAESAALRLRMHQTAGDVARGPVRGADGKVRLDLLGPDDGAYLGDRTARGFRIDIGRDLAALDAQTSVFAVPDLDWVRHTGAWNLFGGPAPAGDDPPGTVSDHLPREWERDLRFTPSTWNPYHADPALDPWRAAPSALHEVVRRRAHAPLELALSEVLWNTLRPTPATRPRLLPDTAHLRSGLGSLALESPHGVRALDYEHFGVDLLFDTFWLSGDPLARHELARAGSGLLPLLRHVEMRTSRGEGRCLRAGVAIARVTGDGALLAGLVAHAQDVLLPAIATASRGCALAQPPHPRAFGPRILFDVPEQMAELVLGLAALARAAARDDLRDAALTVMRRVCNDGWMEGEGVAGYVTAVDPPQRLPPPGDAARAGANAVVLTALVIAEEIASSESDRRLFRRRAEELLQDPASTPSAATLTDPWYQIAHDRRLRIR